MNLKNIILLLLLFIATKCTAQYYTYAWAQMPNSTVSGLGYNDYGNGVTVDKNGNVYTVGEYIYQVDFDSSANTNLLTGGTTTTKNTFITKYNKLGALVWAKSITSVTATCVANDADGNIIIGGSFIGSKDFDPNPTQTFTLNANGYETSFLMKLDSNGILVWAENFRPQFGLNIMTDLQVDKNGQIYCTGYMNGNVDFNPSAGIADTLWVRKISYTSDAYIAKVSSNGAIIWAKGFGGTYTFGLTSSYNKATVSKLALDNLGAVIATGSFTTKIDFDPSTAFNNLYAGSKEDIFIVKLDSNGNYAWAKNYGNYSDYDYGRGIATDANNSVIATGIYTGIVDFDPSGTAFSLTSSGSGSPDNAYILKLKPNGDFLWAKKLGVGDSYNGNSGAVKPVDAFTDANGNIYTSGSFESSTSGAYRVDFNPSTAIADTTFIYMPPGGNSQLYISKLDSNGNYVSAVSVGSVSVDIVRSIFVDSAFNMYLTGGSGAGVCFDPNNINNGCLPGTYANYDIILLKYGQAQTPLSITNLVFTGVANEQSDVLNWTTSAETNNAYFNLQHSTDGIYFSTIEKIITKAENGNSDVPLTYTAINNYPVNGNNFYRLQSVDVENKIATETQIVNLIRSTEAQINLYPNPVQDNVNIEIFVSKNQIVDVQLTDMIGKIVMHKKMNIVKGSNRLQLDLENSLRGFYTITIKNANSVMYIGKVIRR
jgi:Secretion system C-terminal sorting domain/Beta-propeller repeat